MHMENKVHNGNKLKLINLNLKQSSCMKIVLLFVRYKRKLQEMLDEDEEIQTKKRKKISEVSYIAF